jgi:hypothetical protein
MVKLLDPFSGYQLAYGNTILHLSFIILYVFILQYEEPCFIKDKADYGQAKTLLLASHITVFVLSVVSYFMSLT